MADTGCKYFHSCLNCVMPKEKCNGGKQMRKGRERKINIEREQIVSAVGKYGNVTKAAEALGVKPYLLYKRIAMRDGKTKITWKDVMLVLKWDGDKLVVESTNIPLDKLVQMYEIRGKVASLA